MRLLFFTCLLLIQASLRAQTTIVPLHPDGVKTDEPCIAIHPNNPSIQILGSNTSYFFASQNGGFNWTPMKVVPKEGFYGDPVVHITPTGDWYMLHLARNPKLEWPQTFDRIVFEKSSDQGLNWKSTGVGHNPGKMQDKPWIAVDEGRKSPYKGRIYISWTEFDRYGSNKPEDSSRIRFAWSENAGDSFSTVVVSDTSGDALDGDNTLEGATCAVGPKGELYMVWAGKGKLWFDKSSDGGKTWGTDVPIENQVGGWNNEDIPGLMRANSMPFLSADKSGILYLVFGDKRNGDYDVFLKVSQNGGKTWTPAIRLNTDKKGNGIDQYMPAICVDKAKNKLYALWYDRSNSENNIFTDVYLCPLGKEKQGSPFRVTNSPFCPPGKEVFFGDYISVAAAKSEVRAAFAIYDNEKQISTVNIALLNDKIIRKYHNAAKPDFLEAVRIGDTALIGIHFRLNGVKSCTLEITRGRQVFYRQLFDPLEKPEQEIMLPLSRFKSGVYKVTLSNKGRKIEKDLFIEADRRD
jgi:hypothetical protein